MNKNFLAVEKDIHGFAQELYFRNEVAIDLVEKDEQKDLLHFDRKDVAKLQEIASVLQDFCQPQVRAILQVSENTKDVKNDFKLIQNQAHQLIQNFSNLEKLVTYSETKAKKKSKNLSKQWLELKQNLLKMDIIRIKEFEKSSKPMS